MTRANTLPTMLSREMPLYLLQSFRSALFLYRVVILESLVSCGTAPSCQHWQMTLCSGSSSLAVFDQVRGNPIIDWGLA